MTAKPTTITDLHVAAEAIADAQPVPPKATVHQALAAVMAEVQSVGKDGHNSSQNYAFRGIDGVMNAVGPALRKHGVVIIPVVLASNYRDVEVGKNRTLMREVTVTVEYEVFGPQGDSITGRVSAESMDSGDKGTAKAFSVAYRTFLLQALTIPTHEPDPDETSYERSAAPEPEFVWTRGAVKARLLELLGDETAAKEAWTNGKGDDLTAWSAADADRLAALWRENQPAEEPTLALEVAEQ